MAGSGAAVVKGPSVASTGHIWPPIWSARRRSNGYRLSDIRSLRLSVAGYARDRNGSQDHARGV
jgi:hypothetical protein